MMLTDGRWVRRGNSEGDRHLAAKLKVAAVLEAAWSGGPPPTVACPGCGALHPLATGPATARVVVEPWISAVVSGPGNAMRPDVGVRVDGAVLLAVEVRDRGPVTRDRRARYIDASIPFVEMRAADILADPWRWRPVQSWGLPCDRVTFEEPPPPAER